MDKMFLHHLYHLAIYSFVIWQVIIGIWLLLIWVSKNIKFHKSPILGIGETIQKNVSVVEETKVKKDMGPIEVGVKKNVIMDTKSDESSVKLDEKIKGKVKTQKNKLRELRK